VSTVDCHTGGTEDVVELVDVDGDCVSIGGVNGGNGSAVHSGSFLITVVVCAG
jgi:hypothetical protein